MFFDIVHSLESSNLPEQSKSTDLSGADAPEPGDFLAALLNSLPVQLPPAEVVEQQLSPGPLAGEALPPSGNGLPPLLIALVPEEPLVQQPQVINYEPDDDALSLLPLRAPDVLVPDLRGATIKGPVVADIATLPLPALDLPIFQPAPLGHGGLQVHATPFDHQPTAQIPVLTLNQPVGQPQWREGLGTRVVWLAKQGIQSAELRLHPERLGPIEIHVSVADEIARVSFAAHHSHAREALEAALPQLKEMFAEQGLELADATVSQRFSEPGNSERGSMFDDSKDEAESTHEGEVRADRVRLGLVDDYA